MARTSWNLLRHAEKKVDAAGLRTASEGIGALLAAVEPMRVLPAHHLSTNADLVERAVDTAFYAGLLAAASRSRDRRKLTDVVLAGALADVGKLELPPELLESSSPLNDRDWELVRWHPHHSVEWIRVGGIGDPSVLRGVAAHHERWSGGGYPYGLSSENIPIEARYVAIADAFGALCVTRPHQESNTAFEALGKMATSGQFEPRLVRTLIRLLKSDETGESDEGDSVPVAKAA
jgi:HD-GYP domain-containing protein (c-di-GMP phosphodiesterase class II)